MLQRTWEYGSRLNAEVMNVRRDIITVLDEHGEGHILVGDYHAFKPAKGDKVTLRFCKGGPTGGFWKIVAKQADTV